MPLLRCLLTLALFFLFSACSHPARLAQQKPQHYRGDTDFHPRAEHPAYPHGKGPVLCFDRAHHNLAVELGYYSSILELLESDGFQVRNLTESPFTHSMLKSCRVLYTSAVVGDADYGKRELAKRSAFTDSEIDAIDRWTKDGGSLLVMTDHRPMSDASSKLLARFGVVGSLIPILDPAHPIPPFTEPGIFEISRDGLGMTSPILRGRSESERIQRVFFFYGQALSSLGPADVFLKTGNQAILGEAADADTASVSRFPALALAKTYGKGRLIAFGDATVFTSKMDLDLNERTGMNREGSDNIQLALNAFHWLARIL